MRNYFTFDGIDSRSFGVYISGQGTFKAPARSYDALEIPGRNGALLGIDSRLDNVELTYPAFIYSNFAENIAAFRAFLLSHKGYFKLKDSYHPDEFRLAYYPGPFEPDVTSANNAGSFDITFICKPQRYLESGQEVVELSPSTAQVETYTGNIVEIEPGIGDRVTGLAVPFIPIQDLHGYSHPWPAGGGKNLLNPATMAPGYLENSGNVHAQDNQKEYYSTEYYEIGSQTSISVGYNAFASTESKWIAINWYDANKTNLSRATSNESISIFTPVSGAVYFRVSMRTYDHGVENCYCAFGSDTTYSPYSNICPISGRTGLSVYVGPTQDQQDATTYAFDWTSEAGTVYGGTLDVVSGLLTVNAVYFKEKWKNGVQATRLGNYTRKAFTHPIKSKYPSYTETPISNVATYQAAYTGDSLHFYVNSALSNNIIVFLPNDTDGETDIEIVYELATPLTYQLTPQEITLIQNALNYIWSNAGPVTVEVTEGLRVTNPTLFDALPFLRVYGTGILGIGSHTITITAADVYTDIDCEMMDCFKGSANKNQYVQFSGNDFPTLEPGVNGFSFSGITKVEVKPRWWSV